MCGDGGGGGFFQYRSNVKTALSCTANKGSMCRFNFSSQFYLHINVEFDTRFHAFMLSPITAFM